MTIKEINEVLDGQGKFGKNGRVYINRGMGKQFHKTPIRVYGAKMHGTEKMVVYVNTSQFSGWIETDDKDQIWETQ